MSLNKLVQKPSGCCLVWFSAIVLSGIACCGTGAVLATRLVVHWTR